MKKKMKKLLIRIVFIIFYVLLLNILSVSVWAYSESDTQIQDGKLTIKYEVEETEENTFLENVKNTITKDNKEYQYLDSTKISGGTTELVSEREYSNQITLDKNDLEYVLSQIPSQYEYTSEDGFTGTLSLDNSSISSEEILGDTYSYIVTQTKTYTEYSRNDLDTIPKSYTDKGITYYLITPKWTVVSTEVIDGQEVPSVYSGTMTYQGTVTARYPSTYNITYTYKGNVTKQETSPLVYSATYEEIKQNTNIIPIVAGSGIVIIVFVWLFFLFKNTKIYNIDNGNYKKIANINLNDKKEINLDKYQHKCTTNKFKISMNNKTFQKLKGKSISFKYKAANKVIVIKEQDQTFII